MPATTSPLMALRFSGRLMVIQNACPRFSSTTLPLSVIALLARLLSANINGRMAADCKDDLSRRSSRWSGLFHPDLVVVECRTADRRDRFRSGERIDATTADVVPIPVNRFGDQHAAAQT